MRDTPPIGREQVALANTRYSACTIRINDTTSSFLSSAATPSSIVIYSELDTTTPLGILDTANTAHEVVRDVLATGANDAAHDEVYNGSNIEI
jgi:hypothetical protein